MKENEKILEGFDTNEKTTIFAKYKRVREVPTNMYLRVDAWHHYACHEALRDACRPYDAHVYAVIASFSVNQDGSEKRSGHCYLPATTIAAMIGRGREAVGESIDRLIDCGLLVELERDGAYAQKNLHANLHHPAVLYARGCQSGEIGDREQIENSPKTAVERIIDFLKDAVNVGDEKTLEVIASAFGNLSVLSALSGDLASRIENGATFLEASEAIAREGLSSQPGAAANLTYDDDYEALANRFAEHTTRMVDSPESVHAYAELRKSGYSANEIDDALSALEAHHTAKKTDGDQWPSILSFLRGERSCRAKWGAKRLMDDARKKAELEKAAAETAEAERKSKATQAERAAEIDNRVAELLAADADYQAWKSEVEELSTHLVLKALPGTPAAAALERHAELADLTAARIERYTQEASAAYDAEHPAS